MLDATLKTQDDAAAAVATAPRVTLEYLESEIEVETYINAGRAATRQDGVWCPSLDLLTICVLVLRNGFTVTGESACASPENYDEALGRQIARRHAVEKMWPLYGFMLRERLSQAVPA